VATVTCTPITAGWLYYLASEVSAYVDGSWQLTDSGTWWPGFETEAAISVDVPILMYHKIEPTIIDSDYWVSTAMFEQQLDALQAYDYTVISLDDFMAIRSGAMPAPTRPVILTIDDGYLDLYTEAYDILHDRGLQATAFLPTDFLYPAPGGGRQDSSWDPDPIESANPVPHLLWDEVRTMDTATVAFGSHSLNHPDLTTLTEADLAAQVSESKAAIEAEVPGSTAAYFSYPFGAYNPAAQEAVRDAGYVAAVGAWGGMANTGTSDLWALERENIGEHNSVVLDQARPGDFFMRKVDPAFPLPLLQVDSVRTYDGYGRERSTYYPSEWVQVLIHLTNNGETSDLMATLNLDDDTNDATPPLYDSSTTEPSDDIAFSLAHGASTTLTFYFQIPADAAAGPIYYALGIRDPHKVLGFLFDGWTQAFAVDALTGLTFPEPSMTAQRETVGTRRQDWITVPFTDGISYQVSLITPDSARDLAEEPLHQATHASLVDGIYITYLDDTPVMDSDLEENLLRHAQNIAEFQTIYWPTRLNASIHSADLDYYERPGYDAYIPGWTGNETMIFGGGLGIDDYVDRRRLYRQILINTILQPEIREREEKEGIADNKIDTLFLGIVEMAELLEIPFEVRDLTVHLAQFALNGEQFGVPCSDGSCQLPLAMSEIARFHENRHLREWFFKAGEAMETASIGLQTLTFGVNVHQDAVRALAKEAMYDAEAKQRLEVLEQFIVDNTATLDPALVDAYWDIKPEITGSFRAAWEVIKGVFGDGNNWVSAGRLAAALLSKFKVVAPLHGVTLAKALGPWFTSAQIFFTLLEDLDLIKLTALAATLDRTLYDELLAGKDEISSHGILHQTTLDSMRLYLGYYYYEGTRSFLSGEWWDPGYWIQFAVHVVEAGWTTYFECLDDLEEQAERVYRNYTENQYPDYLATGDMGWLRSKLQPSPDVYEMVRLDLRPGQSETVHFRVRNDGGSADPFYLSVSASEPLTVTATSAHTWMEFAPGDTIWGIGDNVRTGGRVTAVDRLFEVSEPFPASQQERDYWLTFQATVTGTYHVRYRVAMVPDGVGDGPLTTQRAPTEGEPDQQGWPAAQIEVDVDIEPDPQVSVETGGPAMLVGEVRDLTLTLANHGGMASDTYLDLSVSDGITIVQWLPADLWDLYPEGSLIWRSTDTVEPTLTSVDPLLSAPLSFFGAYSSRDFVARIAATAAGDQWIKVRAAMNPYGTPPENSSSYNRDPESGPTYDQQGWPVHQVGLWVSDNLPPQIVESIPASTTPTVNEGECLDFSVTATDPNGETLVFQYVLDNRQVVSEQSAFTYCPGSGAAGEHDLVVYVADEIVYVTHQWTIMVEDAADTVPPVIVHTSPAASVEGTELLIDAVIVDDVAVAEAEACYRQAGAVDYWCLPMFALGASAWQRPIAPSEVRVPGLEYYLRASDGANEAFHGTPSEPHQVAVSAQPDTQAPQISHSPASAGTEGTSLAIQAEIWDNVAVAEARLLYRTVGQASYKWLWMARLSGDVWQGTVPGAEVSPDGLEYYLWASDGMNDANHGSAESPHLVNVSSAPDTEAPQIDHTAVLTASEAVPLPIEALVTDNVVLVQVLLLYRPTGTTRYYSLEMATGGGSLWRATIPAESVTAAGLEYYLYAYDGTNQTYNGTAAVPHPVSISGGRPRLVVSPTGLTFQAREGGVDPVSQALSITNAGSGVLSWSISDDATWLWALPGNGVGDALVAVDATVGGLTQGLYLAELTVQATGALSSPWTVPVTLEVEAPPAQVVINEIDAGDGAAVELHNAGGGPVGLEAWALNLASEGGAVVTYTLPAFTLDAGAFVVVHEGAGTDTATDLYTGLDLPWTDGGSGSCALVEDSGWGADFVRWGASTAAPPSGTGWSGTNPPAPIEGHTLGRDGSATDTGDGSDWCVQAPTLGTANGVCLTCYALTRIHSGLGLDPVAEPDRSPGCLAGEYGSGQLLELSAAPAEGWRVASWTGTSDDASTALTNTLTMTASAHTVKVAYELSCYPLTLDRVGLGALPYATPAESEGCPASAYLSGEVIQLSGAEPGPGWQIAGWMGTDDDAGMGMTNTLTMPAAPHQVAVDYGGLTWFAAPEDTQPNGLTWDGSHLWLSSYIANGGIYKLDPGTGAVLSSCQPPVAQYNGYGGLAFDGTDLWEADFYGGGVYRIDPAGCGVLASLPSPGRYLGDMAWDGTHLWVGAEVWNGSDYDEKVLRLDPADGMVVDEIPLTDTASGPHVGAAFGDGYLWVSADAWLLRYDANSGQLLGSTPLPVPRPEGLAWDGEYLWVSSFDDGLVYQLEAPLPAEADLSLAKDVAGSGPTGGELAYTVTFTNSGPAAAAGVVVTDALPPGLILLTAQPPPTEVVGDSLLRWELGSLSPGTSGTIVITASVDAGLPGGSQVDNLATIGSSTNDPDPGDNAALASTVIGCAARINDQPVDYASVQAAVDAAGPGDLVKIAGYCAGVESRSGVTQTVYLTKTLTLRGGYSTHDWTTPDPVGNPTTLDGQGKGRVLYVTGNISPTIEGLHITGGDAAGLGGNPYGDDAGGGAYIITATVSLIGCQVEGNTSLDGGGLYLSHSDSHLRGNVITANEAADDGGGVYLHKGSNTLRGNTISLNASNNCAGLVVEGGTVDANSVISNTASIVGGGLCLLGNPPAVLTDNLVAHNSASSDGGGVHVDRSAGQVLTGNTIAWNTSHRGGGLYLEANSLTLSANSVVFNTASYGGGLYFSGFGETLASNLVTSNSVLSNTASYGGGLYLSAYRDSNTWNNNVVADNQAIVEGSGLYIRESSSVLQHSTIVRNTGGDGSAILLEQHSSVAMTNTILVSHTVGLSVSRDCTATLEATLWGNGTDRDGEGTVVTGTVNEWGNPAFTDPGSGDYHLESWSAAADAGVDAGVMVDIDGDLRPYGSGFDLGADELSFCSGVTGIPYAECRALVALYTSTDGPNWTDSTGWLETTTPCINWYGVTCDEDHVYALQLAGNQLSGSIAPELGSLTGLWDLYLNNNQLQGPIPPEMGGLAGLRVLQLYRNQLSGNIPPTLGSLVNLELLNLNDNQLDGEIPPELGNLGKVWSLSLGRNRLTGSIPSELAGMQRLQGLGLYHNQLTGRIPTTLGSLTNLEVLNLYGNQLSGSIPSELGHLPSLLSLSAGSNQLNGPIPPDLGNLANLRYLNLSDNPLGESLPPELGSLANLEELHIFGSQLTGTIPPELGQLANLQILDLSRNQLTGELPSQLESLAGLKELRLRDNQLSGGIPPEFGALDSLDALLLSNNQLDSNLPPEIGGMASLRIVHLGENQLSGGLPSELGNLSNLEVLQLQENRLTGAIPPALGDLTRLSGLWLNGNALGGEIPSAITNLTNLIGGLNLHYNMLTASDPAVLAYLDEIYHSDWANTQTVPPTNLAIVSAGHDHVELTWQPITYTLDGGFYEVSYATSAGDPYTVAGTTADKTGTGYVVEGLAPGTSYHFVVRTHTPAHWEQQNDLWSSWSTEISATTLAGHQTCWAQINDDLAEYDTVQAAVDAASPGDLIKVAGTCRGVELREGLQQTVQIDKTLTVQGGYTVTNWTVADPLVNPTTLDAQGEGRVLYVTGNITPTIDGLRITGGDATGLGGDFVGNDIAGGVYVLSSTVTIRRCRMEGNTALDAGALSVRNGEVVLESSVVVSNTAQDDGGALLFQESTGTVIDSTIADNSASNCGALTLWDSNISLSGNMIAQNTATLNGGGICLIHSPAVLTDNTIANNLAGASGGGVHLWWSDATLNGNMVGSNIAARGGGLYLEASDAQLNGNRVISNTADHGGGLFLDNSPASIAGNTIAQNTATTWGAGLNLQSSHATVRENEIYDNVCSGDGAGGLGLYASNAIVESNTFRSNDAVLSGGAVYANGGQPELLRNRFEVNGAHNAVFLWRSDALLDANTVADSNMGVFMFDSRALLTNNILSGNSSSGLVAEGASPQLIHNTLVGNGTGLWINDRWQEGIYYTSTVALTNTILSGNLVGLEVGADNRADLEATLWFDNGTDWSGGGAIGHGAISLWRDPRFLDAGQGDYHLDSGSGAVDAGVDAGVVTDLDGDPRPLGGGFDIGADESAAMCQPVSGMHLSRMPAGDLKTGDVVRFVASAGGSTPFSYAWTLDGGPVGGDLGTWDHVFGSAGVYEVSVTATNDCGAGSDTLIVNVGDASGTGPNLSPSYKSVSLRNVDSGDVLTYTLILRNESTLHASATLSDAIPTYTTYVPGSARASDGGSVTYDGGQLLWSGQVITGTPVVLDYAVVVGTPPVGTVIRNAAKVDDGAGGTALLEAASTYNPGYRLTINDGALATHVPTVTLRYAWDTAAGITHVRFSNDGGFAAGSQTSTWLPVNPTEPVYHDWRLETYGDLRMPRTVYAKFRDSAGRQFGPYQDDIIYDSDPPEVLRVEIHEQAPERTQSAEVRNVVLRVTVQDANTGATMIHVSHDEGFGTFSEFTVTGGTTDIPWALSAFVEVHVRVADRAGNLSDVTSTGRPRPFSIYLPIAIRGAP
jgi:uncharacterized repeat protein (TIGR01451 family)